MSKFRESGKILITLKVSKNNFSHVYEQKFGQKCHWCGQFAQNISFWLKWSKLGNFVGQNEAISQKFGESGQKMFSLKISKNYFS